MQHKLLDRGQTMSGGNKRYKSQERLNRKARVERLVEQQIAAKKDKEWRLQNKWVGTFEQKREQEKDYQKTLKRDNLKQQKEIRKREKEEQSRRGGDRTNKATGREQRKDKVEKFVRQQIKKRKKKDHQKNIKIDHFENKSYRINKDQGEAMRQHSLNLEDNGSTQLMLGYLLKCGLPQSTAELACFKTGPLYLPALNEIRKQGAGKLAKANAAMTCIFMVTAHFKEYGFENKQGSEEIERLSSTLGELKALGLALAAIKTYAFAGKSRPREDNYDRGEVSFAEDEAIIDAISYVGETCGLKEANVMARHTLDEYKAKLAETVAVARAHASKKGFLTKMFG